MAISLRNQFPQFFTFMCILLPSLAEPTDEITSCLTLHNINNFTTFPNTENDSDSYFKLLNFSIQNLRFAEPTVPKPIAIILPESVEQIINSVYCSREVFLAIRVRCGGHSYEGTSSVAADGAPFVIIDMMNLNTVSVDLETEMAWVEGGATLGETYHAIAKASSVHGFSAGSCPTVGAGGHIAGGGFGLLSRKYGLAADNVVDALLIDADGRLLDRRGMGEDVFWAIRGGGGGVWGIVYAWKIQLLRVPQTVTVFVASRAGNKSHVANLVDKWQHVAPYLEDDFYISCFVGAGLPEAKTSGTTGISATFKGFYLGPRSSAMSTLDQVFPDIGIVKEDCKEMSWIESTVFFSGLGNGSSVSDLRNRYLENKGFFKAKSDYVRTAISHAGIRAAVEILEEEPKGYIILDPYGGIMHRISSESIAFPHRKGNLFTIQYLVEWKEEENYKRNEYVGWIRRLYNSMTPYVSWGPRTAYINYIDLDLGVMRLVETRVPTEKDKDAVEIARVWGEKYFLNNYDRLVRAKTIIDPRNVFSNQQGIPPVSYLSQASSTAAS
ncbi:PREDICTED: reticuline oxidase-like isoform X1 [Fragaria vesca subsp. vesca]|uniref:reticuline oxidase-like isoform X1 n=1 Tax=Fragaria vesca subsp. vesca TaxID=101020 RepID=UPI0002C31FE1|nr:PREDICTED: reticuline oxidase-like isoform X1 [Fragaria vesca subsp. vesca]